MLSCSCGKTFKTRGRAELHLVSAPDHAITGEAEPGSRNGPVTRRLDPALHPSPPVLEVYVRLDGKMMTLTQFLELTNRMNTLKDFLRRFSQGE